jgi:hypothetical protein
MLKRKLKLSALKKILHKNIRHCCDVKNGCELGDHNFGRNLANLENLGRFLGLGESSLAENTFFLLCKILFSYVANS